MTKLSTILTYILINIFVIEFSSASLLLVDRKNPCRAYGNASVYDITNLVKTWPTTIMGSGFDRKEYIYWWSCAGKTVHCQDTDTAVCQQRTDGTEIRFNAGNVSPQLWFGTFNGAAFQVKRGLHLYFSSEIFCFYSLVESYMDYNVSKSTIRSIINRWYRYSGYYDTFYC